MHCPACGAENTEGAQSCAHCHGVLSDHASVRGEENQSSPQARSSHQQTKIDHSSGTVNDSSSGKSSDPFDTKVKRVSSGVNIGIIIGTIFFPVIGVAMGYTYLKKDHPEERKAGKNWLILGVVMFIVNILLISVLKR